MSKFLTPLALVLCCVNGSGVAYSAPSPSVSTEGKLSRVCVAGSGMGAITRARAKLAQQLADEKRQAIYGRENVVGNESQVQFAAISGNYIEPDKFQYSEFVKDNTIHSCASILK